MDQKLKQAQKQGPNAIKMYYRKQAWEQHIQEKINKIKKEQKNAKDLQSKGH